ncbi:MAG: lipid-A-disaccharide synthase [Deltaproteobacteria bacterium]|nr:lipid-A-disaccharide synthase [Deltaproteobacteria bacterium]
MEEKRILIISGEASGDIHGAALIEELKGLIPSLKIFGMGGPRMREAGQEGFDAGDMAVVGVAEVVGKLPAILRRFKELKSILDREKIDGVVLIDYPDFNLRFAKEAKKRDIPVIYYISPQVWAWRRGRVKKIARLVDKMLVVFPFEVPIYEEVGVDVEFVGHPLMDRVSCPLDKNEAKAALGYHRTEVVVTLLPGSRKEEISRLLPPMLEGAIEAAEASRWKVRIIIPAAENIDETLLNTLLQGCPEYVKTVKGQMYTALRASDTAAIASGTATLESAIIGTPMLILYKLSTFSYMLAKLLVGLEYVGLPNIVSETPIVPELIQGSVTPANITEELCWLIEGGATTMEMMAGIEKIRDGSLGKPGASKRAAEAVFRVLEPTTGVKPA